MEALCIPALRAPFGDLQPYTAAQGRAAFLRMDANEGASPDLKDLSTWMAQAASCLTLYPEYGVLRRAAADAWKLAPEAILPVNGADEGLALAIRGLGGPLVLNEPTFAMARLDAELEGAEVRSVPLLEDFSLDLEALLEAIPGAGLVYLASPDNPSGRALSEGTLRTVLDTGVPVLLDETYAAFCGQDFRYLLDAYPNLLILRTLSKAHGVPGLRCGFLLGPTELMAGLDVLRNPYSVNGLAAALGAQLLRGDVGFRARLAQAVAARRKVEAGLLRAGIPTVPTETHFLLARFGEAAAALAKRLEARGILVRAFGGAMAGWLRFSLAGDLEAGALLEALQAEGWEVAA